MSNALIKKNKDKVCLVFCCKNITERIPAINPAIEGANFVYPNFLLPKQIIALNIPENVAINIEKLKLSLENKIEYKSDGFFNIDLMPKINDSPDLIQ